MSHVFSYPIFIISVLLSITLAYEANHYRLHCTGSLSSGSDFDYMEVLDEKRVKKKEVKDFFPYLPLC